MSTRLLVPIHLRGRDPMLGPIFKAPNHPLVQRQQVALVVVRDTSESAMEELQTWEEEQPIPAGTDEEFAALGLYQLDPTAETLVFGRAAETADPNMDVLLAWYTPASFMDDAAKQQLLAATNAAMGDESEMTLSPPVFEDGAWTGGLLIERGADPVEEGTRCYTIANSLQSQRDIWSPCADSKVCRTFSKDNELRRDLNIAVGRFSAEAMKQIPPSVRSAIEDYKDMLNVPPLGVPRNVAHNALQLNIAPAVPFGSKQGLSSLGTFGKSHKDKKDDPGRYTHMTTCSRLPDNYILGKFHIIALGIYVTLHNYDSVNFCGLFSHGGTPPVAPEGEEVQCDAYRLTFISYPPLRMGGGGGNPVVAMGLGSMPFEQLKQLRLVDSEEDEPVSYMPGANFAVDGQVVMNNRAHVTFIARALLLHSVFILNQLPPGYNVQVDSDRLLSAISFLDGGIRESVGPWANAPGYRRPHQSTSSPSAPAAAADNVNLSPQRDRRSEILHAFYLHSNRMRPWIPHKSSRKLFDIDTSGALVQVEPVNPSLPPPTGLGNNRRPGMRPRTAKPKWKKPVGITLAKPKWKKRTTAKPRPNPRPGKKRANKSKNPAGSGTDANDNSPANHATNGGISGIEVEDPRDGDFSPSSPSTGMATSTPGSERQLRSSKRPQDESSSSDNPRKRVRITYGQQPGATRSDNAPATSVHDLWANSSLAALESDPAMRESSCLALASNAVPVVNQIRNGDGDMVVDVADITLAQMFPPPLEYYDAATIFCNKLAGAIIQERDNILRAYQQTSHHRYIAPFLALDAAFDGIRAAPGSVATCVSISRVWSQLDRLNRAEGEAMLQLKLIRYSVMQSTGFLWCWLDTYCVSQIRAALQAPTEIWIGRLARLIHTLMSTGIQKKRIRPKDVGLDGIEAVFDFKQRTTFDLTVDEQLLTGVVLEIIAFWLNFPRTYSRQQSWFINTMVTTGYSSALFLDCAWGAFTHVRSTISGTSDINMSTPVAFSPLALALRNLALTNEQTVALEQMRTALFNYRHRAIADAASFQLQLAMIPSQCSKRVHAMNRFLEWLLQLEPLIGLADTVDIQGDGTLGKFQRAVHQDRDYLLPFREHGPSRIVSRLPGNAFDPLHARARSGLYSGLLFWGVYFATKFAHHATSTLFASPRDWDAQVAAVGQQPPTFFCNVKAYGSVKCYRSVKLVQQHFDAVITPGTNKPCPGEEWEQSTRDGKFPFRECHRFLTRSKPRSLFLEIGDLIAFLLAADFVYAGAVEMPSVDDAGYFVWKLNAGAVRGLETLGLIAPRRRKLSSSSYHLPDEAEVKSAFSQLYGFLDSRLSPEQKERMVFDLFMVENSLCKSGRWIAAKLTAPVADLLEC
ncbi:hypothetical protein FB45DRAFT_958028 [Roridomyces roridus]|uniref:Uncharacterized protein n=1 Tax=Roridomyces roridus TaxID=1738132 RepID=A0AAD7AYC4_9AGAR|nr:hypothetical protein FB45DRAFT_958028 [Roridomyces roridus]